MLHLCLFIQNASLVLNAILSSIKHNPLCYCFVSKCRPSFSTYCNVKNFISETTCCNFVLNQDVVHRGSMPCFLFVFVLCLEPHLGSDALHWIFNWNFFEKNKKILDFPLNLMQCIGFRLKIQDFYYIFSIKK